MIRHTEIHLEGAITYVARYVNNTQDRRMRVPNLASAVSIAGSWADSDVFLKVDGKYLR